MVVKASRSASRVLSVVELIASHQPIGVAALARLLDEDRSAVQRAVRTLADAGWARMTPNAAGRWELTAHLFGIARLPGSTNELRARARAVLERLRDQTSETAFLAVPDVDHFIVIETLESLHSLRMASRVGMQIPLRGTATARAFFPHVAPDRLRQLLGRDPEEREAAEFAATRSNGYALSAGDVVPNVTNIAAPIFDRRHDPVAVLVVSGPSERLSPDRYSTVGKLVSEYAAALSRDRPPDGYQNQSSESGRGFLR